MDNIEFFISDVAKKQIIELQCEFKKRNNVDIAIPIVLWVFEQRRGKYHIRPGVALGFYDNEDDAGDLMEINGIKIALGGADPELRRFIGKTLDCIDGKFILT